MSAEPKKQKKKGEDAKLEMTPMIDVVFQLLIFFIVTINIADTKDENIQLEFGYHGQEVKTSEQSDTSAVTIDVAMPRAGFPEGRISVGNITIHKENLRTIVRSGRARFGDGFQVWVRGDWRATHGLVRKVMDLCAEEGIGRVTFIAISEAVSKSMVSVAVTMVPMRNAFLTTSATVAFRRSASSLTVISSGICTVMGFCLRSMAILFRRSASVSRLPCFLPRCFWVRLENFCFLVVWSRSVLRDLEVPLARSSYLEL